MYSEKVRGYYDMIDILNECKKEEIDPSINDLCRMLLTCREIINGSIINVEHKTDLTNEYNELIDKYLKICNDGLEEFRKDFSIKTKTFTELEEDIRNDLRTFIINIRKLVSEQNVVDKIIKGVNQTVKDIKDESDDLRKAYFVKEIDAAVTEIREKANEEELEELDKLLNEEAPDRTKDIHYVVGIYVERLRKILVLSMKIDDRIAEEKHRSEMTINIKKDEQEEDRNITVNKR